jgi:hypothetical protein
MSDNKKSTDPGLSAAERKAQRSQDGGSSDGREIGRGLSDVSGSCNHPVCSAGRGDKRSIEDPALHYRVVVSTAWLYRLYRWTGLSDADQHTAFALAYIFFAAAIIAAVVHFRLWRKEWKDGFFDSLQ